MKPNGDGRGPHAAITKRRTRGFSTRDQRLPESPPLSEERSRAQAIMHVMRVQYREAMQLLFGSAHRVLNNECTSKTFRRVQKAPYCPRSAVPPATHSDARDLREASPVPAGNAHTADSISATISGNEGFSRGGATDQVVPDINSRSGSLDRFPVCAKDCQCGDDMWPPGGVTPEDMLRTAKELSKRIMTLYASIVNPETSTVDYSALVHSEDFMNYLAASRKLRYFDPLSLNEEERKAFFLNVYNSLMIHAIAVLWRPKNLYERMSLFNTAAYCIGGRIYTLNMIEHGVLRGNRPGCGPLAQSPFLESDARVQCALSVVDPRIHFALNCGARSCPVVRFYDPATLNETLDMACKSFLSDVQIDCHQRTVTLSKILQWYHMDFAERGDKEALLKWIVPYLSVPKRTALVRLLEDMRLKDIPVRIVYADYDWSVNDSTS